MNIDNRGLCQSCMMFVRALAILALPASRQVEWLRGLGLGEPAVCDELADEFYQNWLLLPQYVAADLVPEGAVEGLNRLNALVAGLITPGSSAANVDSLRETSEWRAVRELAAECLLRLK